MQPTNTTQLPVAAASRMAFSHTVRVFALAAFACASAYTASAQNILVNGDFEQNPPPKLGNNIPWSIAPWVVGTGQQPNVVKVDGPGGYDYGTNGPESDASAPGTKPQHYLDIAGGSNDIYQSFTPHCSGQVRFGGSFSTRANLSGSGSLKIVQGAGLSGPEVGKTPPTTLLSGTSKTDPWKAVSFVVNVVANTTYSFVVHMDNNVNFDNGFVEYLQTCAADGGSVVDPCCPPWNTDALLHQLSMSQSGGLLGNVAYRFKNAAPYKDQMQAYIDYIHSTNPAISNIVIYWSIEDHGPSGPGTTPTATGTAIGPGPAFTEWSCTGCKGYSTTGGGGFITNGDGTNVFDPANYKLPPNRWYRIFSFIYLNDGIKFWGDKCSYAVVDVTVYAGQAFKVADPNHIAIEYRQPGAASGQIMSIPFTAN